jgi:hypothetical protein
MIYNNYDWYPEECARDEIAATRSAAPTAGSRAKWLSAERLSLALSALVGVLLILAACVYFAMPHKKASNHSSKPGGLSSLHPLNLMLWITGRDINDLSSNTDFPTSESIQGIDFQQSQIDWQQQMSLGAVGGNFDPQIENPQGHAGPTRRSR